MRWKILATLVASLVVWFAFAADGSSTAQSKVGWSKCYAQLGTFQCGTV